MRILIDGQDLGRCSVLNFKVGSGIDIASDNDGEVLTVTLSAPEPEPPTPAPVARKARRS